MRSKATRLAYKTSRALQAVMNACNCKDSQRGLKSRANRRWEAEKVVLRDRWSRVELKHHPLTDTLTTANLANLKEVTAYALFE